MTIDQAQRDRLRDWSDVAGPVGAEQSLQIRLGILQLLDEVERVESQARYDRRILWAEIHAQRNRIAELDASQSDLADRLSTIADEAFGTQPIAPVDEVVTRIEHGITELRVVAGSQAARIAALKSENVALLERVKVWFHTAMAMGFDQ